MPDSYIVTGGAGLLGRQIVRLLLERGEVAVAAFDIRVAPGDLDERVQVFAGDITQKEDVTRAIVESKATCIIHTAAAIAVNGASREVMQRVNVGGTRLLLDTAIAHGVKKFVYTSSASVVFAGVDQQNVDETAPYPEKPVDGYTETKALAERMVLEADKQKGLKTCALRVAGLFGPGDRVTIPAYMKTLRQGRSGNQIGNNTNVFDTTYIENAAHAHLLAADRLSPSHPKLSRVAGQTFFITNGEPRPFWDVPRAVWKAAGHEVKPGSVRVVPVWLAYCIAWVMQVIGWLTGWRPTLTPYIVMMCTTTRSCNISKARECLDYEPRVSLDEGIKRSVEWYLEAEKSGEKKL